MSIWSRRFAETVARELGYFDLTEEERAGESPAGQPASGFLDAMTETFRYLSGEPVNRAIALARFLRSQEPGTPPQGWVGAKLQEVHDYLLFLRVRHGSELPADESDDWTEEDRRDLTEASLRRLDREDPYPWAGGPDHGAAG